LLGVAAHTCNPNTLEAERGGLWIKIQLHKMFCLKKQTTTKLHFFFPSQDYYLRNLNPLVE
jgi:hypothetical protein